MGAPTVTSATLSETLDEIKMVFTGSFTDTQETGALKVDASTFHNIDPTNGIVPKLSIKDVEWSVSGTGVVDVIWDASSGVTALQLGGAVGHLDFKDAPLANAGGSGVTGDIKFTTVGMQNPSTYQVFLTLRKEKSAFTSAPIVVTTACTDAHSGTYVTGDTILLQLTFNQPVFANGQDAKVGITLDTGTVYARYNSGDGTTAMTFAYTFAAADGVAAANMALGHLTGVRGSLVGGLSAVDVLTTLDVSGFNVNVPTIASLTGITNGHAYVTSNVISITANFSEPVLVTGTPFITTHIGSNNRHATYVSGSGTSALLFQYTVVGGDAATAGNFSLTSPLQLNSGTIKTHTVAATTTFSSPTTTTVTVN